MNRTPEEDPQTLVFHKEISWHISRIQTLLYILVLCILSIQCKPELFFMLAKTEFSAFLSRTPLYSFIAFYRINPHKCLEYPNNINSCNFQKSRKAGTEGEELWPNGSLQVDHPINVENYCVLHQVLVCQPIYLQPTVLLQVLIKSLSISCY